MSNFDKAVEIIGELATEYGQPGGDELFGLDEDAALALKEAGLLAPDVPEIKHPGFWVDGLEINTADKDGEVLIEWEDESDYAYYGTQTRNLWLNRDQVLAILAASDYAEKKKED